MSAPTESERDVVRSGVTASATASSLPAPWIKVLLRDPHPSMIRSSYPAACRHGGTKCVLMPGSSPSVAPHQRDDPALYLDAVGWKDAGFMPFVTGLQRDRVASAAQALEGDLCVVDQGYDYLAILGGFAF
jgi:hypothetical protein